MSYEERRALLGDVEPQRRGAPVVAIGFAAVAALGVSGAILGRALLEGRFTLGEALAC
mgnify:CR=1 FL=1